MFFLSSLGLFNILRFDILFRTIRSGVMPPVFLLNVRMETVEKRFRWIFKLFLRWTAGSICQVWSFTHYDLERLAALR